VHSHRSLASFGILIATGALVGVTSGPGVAGASRSPAPGASARADLPADATPVTTTEGITTPAIDAHLTTASSISGSFRTTTGKGLSGEIDVYQDGKLVASDFASSGHYRIDGLGAGSYAVCARETWRARGSGYLGRCWKNAAFYGTVPGGATLVTLGDAEPRTGIDLALPPAAAIAGTVTTPGGVGLDSVGVFAHNRSTGKNYRSVTQAGGLYSVKGLGPSAKGYRVCFKPQMMDTGTGYLPQCYKNTSWNGGKYPTSVTAVAVTLGKSHVRVNQTLPPGGAIVGKVTDAKTGVAVGGVPISAYSAGGRLLGSTWTSSKGHYRITSLAAASGDRVCASPFTRSATLSYQGVCWKNVVWNGGGLPRGTAPVRVRTSTKHTGVDLRLRRAPNGTASVAGTVTQKSDGTPIEGAFAYLYRNGVLVNDKATNASGQYRFGHLKAATGWTVCVSAFSPDAPAPPDDGWAPRCYVDVPWDGGLKAPQTATKFALGAGQNLAGIDVALRPGVGIAGTVFASDGVTPVPDVAVDVFTVGGALVSFANTGADGTYLIRKLSETDYVVCFDGRFTMDSGSFAPQCFDNVPWSGR
jgi:hypothetical protein